jgi:hypothetical protein
VLLQSVLTALIALVATRLLRLARLHVMQLVTRLVIRLVTKLATRSATRPVIRNAIRLVTRNVTRLARKSATRIRLARSAIAPALTARRQSNQKIQFLPIRYCSLTGAISFFSSIILESDSYERIFFNYICQ